MILLLYCIVTVIIETVFLAAFGYRKKEELLIIVCANVLTNLILNLIISFFGRALPLFILLEIAVVVSEYLIYGTLFGHSRRLAVLTVAANVLSCGIGLVIFG